jgi:hypothetical protein
MVRISGQLGSVGADLNFPTEAPIAPRAGRNKPKKGPVATGPFRIPASLQNKDGAAPPPLPTLKKKNRLPLAAEQMHSLFTRKADLTAGFR